LLLASDAPALDQISLSSDYPFLLPGFLRVLGVTEATILLADLGPSQVRSHSKLLAYKVSVSPNRRAEIGATFMNHYGGEGGRPASIGNRLVDFLPFSEVAAILAEHHQTLTASLEPGALEARHVRLFTADWWTGYPPATAPELARCLQAARRNRLADDADWRTPWELQADGQTLIRYEIEMIRRSASNMQAIGLMN